MIPREEIEFTLAMAEKGIRAEAPAKVMAELCRVYLAFLDAPVAEIDSSGEVVTLIAEGGSLDNAITSARVDAMHGQTVRLVREGCERG